MGSLFPTSGKVLDETQATTQQFFNTGYRRMQDGLCDAGVERFSGEATIIGVPPVTTLDPASQCFISWTTFFDGTGYQTGPVLPINLILPLWMSERPSNTNFPFPDVNRPNMTCMLDGMQSARKYQRNSQWEWREDKIFFPGALIPVDFRIRYRGYLADINNVGNARWFTQPVPVMRCLDALAWWICAEFAAARSADGDASEQMLAIAGSCKEEAVAATKLLANRDVMKNERVNVRRIPYGGGSRGYGGGYGFRG